MIELIETYTWKQAAAKSKLDKLQVEVEMISFAIDEEIDDIYLLSQKAAIEGMIYFDNRMEDDWQARKDYLLENFPKFDFDKRLRYTVDGEPIGEQISVAEFVGFDYQKQSVNVKDYRDYDLAYALLEPPYGLRLEIDAKHGSEEYYELQAKEFTNLYRMFLNDFLLFSKYSKDDFIIYSWSDDWSNFFDAGKEWWGTYYYTVYNKRNNTIIVLGASETD